MSLAKAAVRIAGDVPSAVVTVDVARARCQAIACSHELTEREAEVLCYLARGRDVPAIAEKMLVSKDTVKVHMKGIYRKLDVHTRQELIDLIERDEVR